MICAALLLWLSVGPCEPPERLRVRTVVMQVAPPRPRSDRITFWQQTLIVDWVQF